MEIQQLKHLLAAAEHHNLLRAAESSFISQSGLSRSVRALEDRLGVPLLIRGPKGVEPTIYGHAVMRRARVILNEVAKTVKEIREIEQARVGEVTFGITPNYATYLVPQLLAELHRERPGLHVTVITDGFIELMARVKTESIDFAFGLIGQIRRSDGLAIEAIRAHRSRVMAKADHPLALKDKVTCEDLAHAEWAMLNGEGVQRSFGLFFQTRGLPVPAQVLRSNSISLIRQMVKDSNTISILPMEVVERDLAEGTVVVLDCETPVEQTRVGVFYREDGLLTPQAELVIDLLRRAGSSPATNPMA